MQYCSGSIVVLFLESAEVTALDNHWFYGYNITLPALIAILIC